MFRGSSRPPLCASPRVRQRRCRQSGTERADPLSAACFYFHCRSTRSIFTGGRRNRRLRHRPGACRPCACWTAGVAWQSALVPRSNGLLTCVVCVCALQRRRGVHGGNAAAVHGMADKDETVSRRLGAVDGRARPSATREGGVGSRPGPGRRPVLRPHVLILAVGGGSWKRQVGVQAASFRVGRSRSCCMAWHGHGSVSDMGGRVETAGLESRDVGCSGSGIDKGALHHRHRGLNEATRPLSRGQ
ncbi:hypothetical protein BU16DRAFT_193422 [Lophium mytilinum]|uniref:Uncharacterized protein n=1 Tax=Lophium mytilinum TaxID=390894 RepID=A0A6A6RBT2_9PEZI|nr:hypothetical protein BU16DRAFT_193422 [Lophium mytilinum]